MLKPIVEKKSTASEYTLNSLNEGEYYWKVEKDYGRETMRSQHIDNPHRFDVVKEKNIIPVITANPVTFSSTVVQEKKARLKWSSKPTDKSQITLFSEGDVTLKKTVESNNYTLPKNIKPGEYDWRVKEESTNRMSKTGTIIIKKEREKPKEKPAPIVPLKPPEIRSATVWRTP